VWSLGKGVSVELTSNAPLTGRHLQLLSRYEPIETFQGQPVVRCAGCDVWLRDCRSLWSQQKKCCPDCTHVPTYPLNLKPWELEPHYSRHVAAMTEEGLHDKAAIAEQLAWRDKRIAELETKLNAMMNATIWLAIQPDMCLIFKHTETVN
jgi:hypothetical protein